MLVKNYHEKLINLISNINVKYYFDLIYEIVRNYDIENYILPLCNVLTARVLIEAKCYERKKKNQIIENEILVKSFNIIRTITEKEKFVLKYIVS